MKRTALLLVAVLGLAVASSVQAADVNFKFFSQIGNAPVDTADDVHFTLMSADGDAVAAHAISYLESRRSVEGAILEPTYRAGATFPCNKTPTEKTKRENHD